MLKTMKNKKNSIPIPRSSDYMRKKQKNKINKENRHWTSFYGAVEKEQPISDGILRGDLAKFIDVEITKLEEESKKL